MLPAPTTIATSTPRAQTSWTCFAIALTLSGSVPYSRRPIRASPEIFNSTRAKTGSAIGGNLIPCGRLLLAYRKAGKPGDLDVLAGVGGDLGANLLDRLALIAVRANVLLVEQRNV